MESRILIEAWHSHYQMEINMGASEQDAIGLADHFTEKLRLLLKKGKL